jgi:F0F1-type ATP synthase epsilon subunit
MAEAPNTTTDKPLADHSAATDGIKDQAGKPMIHVKVYSPYQTYFDDDAYSISGLNNTGPFDVLPRHHNFITLLNPCVLEVHVPTTVKRIRISRGVMHVKADQVIVFLDV